MFVFVLESLVCTRSTVSDTYTTPKHELGCELMNDSCIHIKTDPVHSYVHSLFMSVAVCNSGSSFMYTFKCALT